MRIGLIGAPGAGKDVIANFFVKEKGFQRLAFADKIKQEYYAYSGYNEEIFKNARGSKLEQKIRKGLWTYSRKVCQERKDPAYFVNMITSEMDNIKNSVIVTDVRTELERANLMLYSKTRMVFVVRNFKQEIGPALIPGTQISLLKAIAHPIFWNVSDNLKETYAELEDFYKKFTGERSMDPDNKYL